MKDRRMILVLKMNNLLRIFTISILCLIAIPLSVGIIEGDTTASAEKKEIKENDKAPEWIIRGTGIVDKDLYAVGSYTGNFVSERDAYFDGLREISEYLQTFLRILRTKSHSSGLRKEYKSKDKEEVSIEEALKKVSHRELAEIVECRSLSKAYHTFSKDNSGEPSNENNEKTSEEIKSSTSTITFEGEHAHYRHYGSILEKRNKDVDHFELAYRCETMSLSETLKRIPIVDTYIHRKDGRVTTFVLIKYSEEYLKKLKKKELQKNLEKMEK